jgi:hypothetical protein
MKLQDEYKDYPKPNMTLAWIALVFTALLLAVLLGIGLQKFVPAAPMPGPFGLQQTPEQVVMRYQSCKAHAPAHMDCVMIPMLVSDEFMKEHQ